MSLPGACTEVEVSVRETTRLRPPVQRSPSTTSSTAPAADDGTSNNATNRPRPNGNS